MFTPSSIEWSDVNAEAHFAKHGVRFDYAARVFLDPDRADFDVSRPEDGEVRRKAVGMIEGKLYVVVYAAHADVGWIISARRANAQETRRYG
jgi:uncharacterized protein